MKNRIFKVMKWTGLNLSQFADALQVSPALLSSVKSERTKPTLLLVENIKRIYPQIDINWLITGEGEMLVGGNAPGGLHILTDDNAVHETAAVQSPYNSADNDDPAEEISPEKNEYHAEEQPLKPGIDSQRIAPSRGVVSVQTSQFSERKDETPENNDKQVRAVKQVLLMYNDGTYDSFEK